MSALGTASDADQVGVAGACANNLDVAVFFRARLAFLPLIAQILIVDGEGSGPVPAFQLGDNQFAIVCSEDGGCLTDRGGAHVLLNGLAGIRHFDLGKLFGGVEYQFFAQVVDQHRAELFILFHVDGAIALVAGQYAYLAHGLVDLVVDVLVVIGMAGESEA